MKFWLGLCCCLVLAISATAQYKPDKGFVPDKATAIRIAEAVLTPAYGERVVLSERPYSAKLEKGVWTVTGTLWCVGAKGRPIKGTCEGGTAEVKISKSDGRILSMIHTK